MISYNCILLKLYFTNITYWAAFLNDKSDISNHCKELLESYNLPKDKVDEELVRLII